jgi:adenylate cyclase
MDDAQFAELVAWIAEEGLAGEEEPELVSGFCTRAVAFGLPLMRAAVLIDTLHPLYEGHFFGWQADGKTTLREYGSSREGEAHCSSLPRTLRARR